MKFKIGDLVRFVPVDIVFQSGEVLPVQIHNGERGNCIGIVAEINHPLFDSRLYYSYKVHYQNGYIVWETEDNLRYLEKYIRKIKNLEKK